VTDIVSQLETMAKTILLEAHDIRSIHDAIIEICNLRGIVRYYADPQNTVRDCMDGTSCANCDLCKLAQEYLQMSNQDPLSPSAMKGKKDET